MPKLILDGNSEASKLASDLARSGELSGKSLLIIQCDGRHEESVYVRLKREMGERLGVLASVVFAKDKQELVQMLMSANINEAIDGILVQLPIKDATKEETSEILKQIVPEKDIDGLNVGSQFDPSVVIAVLKVCEIFKIDKNQKVAVVGALGEVGKRLMPKLRCLGFEVVGFDKGDDLVRIKECDVVIGATGVSGVIRSDMVRDGFVGIDLGYPRGDFEKEAFEKALMITPVPGGVGPLTVVSLYENLKKTRSV